MTPTPRRGAGAARHRARYQAAIAAASSALELNNFDAAQAFLESAPEEHRNWEWRYIAAQLEDENRLPARRRPGIGICLGPRWPADRLRGGRRERHPGAGPWLFGRPRRPAGERRGRAVDRVQPRRIARRCGAERWHDPRLGNRRRPPDRRPVPGERCCVSPGVQRRRPEPHILLADEPAEGRGSSRPDRSRLGYSERPTSDRVPGARGTLQPGRSDSPCQGRRPGSPSGRRERGRAAQSNPPRPGGSHGGLQSRRNARRHRRGLPRKPSLPVGPDQGKSTGRFDRPQE